ncbi:MAG TPA: hypothetical protein VIJ57_10105, partial [Hanamia sp.]
KFMEQVNILEQARQIKQQLLLSVRNGTHKQFVFDSKAEQVKCKCGHNAVWWKTGFICGTITAYPCKYN